MVSLVDICIILKMDYFTNDLYNVATRNDCLSFSFRLHHRAFKAPSFTQCKFFVLLLKGCHLFTRAESSSDLS